MSSAKYHAIILEFIPQLVFLMFLFGYLISMIFVKWVLYGANYHGQWSEHCAPNLLITFIRSEIEYKSVLDRSNSVQYDVVQEGSSRPEIGEMSS